MARSAMDRIRRAARGMLPALAVVMTISLSGCGSSDESSTPPANGSQPATAATTTGGTGSEKSAGPEGNAAGVPDPCKLVSRQEAEQLAGTALGSPESTPERCVYTAPPDGPTGQVEIFSGQTAQDYLTAERGIGHTLTPLPGIGKEAYIEDYAVFVNVNDFWVSIVLARNNDPAENRGPLENLARTVAGRI
ncbi:DUF3558 domain-containing protein [Frankia sp. CcI49]|nr:hypothetical protein ACG83_24425 [Frankia sp. R43]ONH60556.1 DUF3558 domain-containing protein [Frankia sp. CcI49]